VPNEASGSADPNAGRKITLYGPAEVPFTEKVRRGLLFKGVDFDFVEPTCPEDYRRWNPKSGLLPIIDIDGERTADSTTILFKLDEIFPSPPFLSADPRISSQQTQLENWADENLLFYFNKWLRKRDASERLDGENGASKRPSAMWRRLRAWLRAGGTWERPETAVLRGVADRLDDLIGFLGTRPFFYSKQVSMADLGVYAMLYSLALETIPGSKALVMNRAPLLDFMRRVESVTGDDPEAQ
jgi:glutathione S-transferase